jgi:uncharacterized protein with HEPN domain
VSRRHVLYLKDMEAACRRTVQFAQGLTFEEFSSHGMAYFAIVRNLEIIGEAAKGVTPAVRHGYPER